MKISRAWLEDFVDLSEISNEDVSELLTTRVAEVEGMEFSGKPLEKAVLAEIISIEPHPSSKKLQIVEIDTGSSKKKIVCGAKNPRVGQKTAFVPVGGLAKLGDSLIEITSKEVAGVLSEGMLASLKELDVLDESSGIADIDSSLKAGTELVKIYGSPDVIFEIDNKSLTHRPDLWGHYGFARELAAITNKPLKINLDELSDFKDSGKEALTKLSSKNSQKNISTKIDDKNLASRFSLLEISNVEVRSSPLEISRRLYSVGASTRNIIVDLSNYVMLETGQPNHTYDLDKVEEGQVLVRAALEKEKFNGLDDKEYELSPEDVVIADSSGPIALAGVIGGKESSVTDETKSLLFESGCFDAILVRQSSKRLGVRTDASNRFEKSRTPYAVPLATLRFLELLKRHQPKVEATSSFQDSFSVVPAETKISLSKEYIKERLGAEIPFEKSDEILKNLGFLSEETKSGEAQYSAPWYRTARDISIPEDLVEEVGRVYAYDNIPPTSPKYSATPNSLPSVKSLEYQVCDLLRGMGFAQYESSSFSGVKSQKELGFDGASLVDLKNPIDSNNSVLRTSLAPGMIEAVLSNKRYFNQALLFEMGRVYSKKVGEKDKKSPPCHESRKIAFLLSHFDSKDDSGKLFFQARTALSKIANLVTGSKTELKILSFQKHSDSSCLQDWMHPYRSGLISLEGKEVGVISEAKPTLTDGVRAVFVELDMDNLLPLLSQRTFSSISKFPESLFEISVVTKKGDYFEDLNELLVSSVPSSLLKSLEILSVYSGSPLKEGEKSISVQFKFGSNDRTLSSEELEELQNAILAKIDSSSFSLRS